MKVDIRVEIVVVVIQEIGHSTKSPFIDEKIITRKGRRCQEQKKAKKKRKGRGSTIFKNFTAKIWEDQDRFAWIFFKGREEGFREREVVDDEGGDGGERGEDE